MDEFRAIVEDYLNKLSPKKRDKALVDQHRYCLIQQVLRDPRNTAISTAQFRFWVKKMFQLQPGTTDLVCHDNKPVAMKEQIYDILVKAHREAHHGGRDKTSALVRRRFSWIPKELVARFVRHCPFCITRRNSGHSPTTLIKSPRSRYIRHAYSFDSAAPTICTPSSIKEESDISSGPPSSDSGYEATPNYVALSTCSSPKRPFFNTMYEREDFLDYDGSFIQRPMHPLHHNSAQPQSPLFYQGYTNSEYPFYTAGYYPNALGITPCSSSDTSRSSAAAVAVAAASSTAAAAAAAVALMRSPVTNHHVDLLSHQQQSNSNQFVPFQPLNISENAFNTGL
ncbi:uncharacterized protein B0P05DRAFT_576390 [Gilbertella persicaria]|nr:uncharacterized protein B0P05DRAFT_576390 [Gilbertella persicaria]KAI8047239.1 hypothetical protein B0P05DRAFT_576390 [Gilbertella persicaria]